ncbi:MAG: hypothetical protein Q9178_005539 [Gyalolechia marmorata]
METHPTRIAELGFKVASGVFLGIAITLAGGRTYIRIFQSHTLSIDDGLFFLAVVFLIAGTVVMYMSMPYIYFWHNIDPNTFQITPETLELLQRAWKLQASTSVLFSLALFSVKLSFLMFFRSLLRGLRGLMLYWWCVFGLMVAVAIAFCCMIFIVCPYFDTRVLVRCSTTATTATTKNTLQASVVLDIFTDILVITIPVALLWRVRISFRRKILLLFILSLSIFTMIVCIVRVAGVQLSDGSVDSAWATFWLHIEAAVAVVIISITSYRSLFVKDKPTDRKGSRYHSNKQRLWNRRRREEKGVEMPTMPGPTLTGMRTVISKAGGYDDMYSMNDDLFLPPTVGDIAVTRDADMKMGQPNEDGIFEHTKSWV